MTQTSPGGFIRTEEQALLDTEALRLRSAGGMSYQKIADILGVSKKTAYNRVQRALSAIPAEAVDEFRRVEGERLDFALEAVMEKIQNRDKSFLFAVDRMLTIMDRRAKMMGLDAPIRTEVITLDYIQTEIMRLEAEIGRDDTGGAEAPEPEEAATLTEAEA
jgi:transcriptional regulator with XRE-family HTH domain